MRPRRTTAGTRPVPPVPPVRPASPRGGRRLRAVLTGAVAGLLAALTLGHAPAASAAGTGPATSEATVLRGGDVLHSSSGHRCTLGFNATNGTRYFGIMPGFCGTPGTTWFADPERRTPVGITSHSWFPASNYSLITYTNTALTYPSEVNADGRVVRIEDAREPVSSMRICHVGGATGHRCGALLGPGVPPIDPDHDFRSDICSEPGDAGGPAFQGSSAVGIITGGSGSCATVGTTSYLRITPVLARAGLRVGH